MSVPGPTVTLPATILRDHLFTVLDWIQADRGQVIVLLDGKPAARLRWEQDLWQDASQEVKRTQLRKKIAGLVGQAKRQRLEQPKEGADRL